MGGADGSVLADGRAVCADRTAPAHRHAGQGARGRPAGDQWYRPRAQVRRPLDGRAAGRLRAEEDALQPLRALGGQGGLGRVIRDAVPGRRAALPGADRLHRREGPPLRRRG